MGYYALQLTQRFCSFPIDKAYDPLAPRQATLVDTRLDFVGQDKGWRMDDLDLEGKARPLTHSMY